jgi:hypothetical protein
MMGNTPLQPPLAVSYPTAIALQKAGWGKETALCYYRGTSIKGYWQDFTRRRKDDIHTTDLIYAPTFVEIWGELRDRIFRDDENYYKYLDDRWLIYEHKEVYRGNVTLRSLKTIDIINNNITESAAEMWLWLIKEGLV